MPVYEYQCEACGERYEAKHSINADPETKCVVCGEERLRRLISASSFLLKGAGWFGTDYANKPEH